MIEEVLLPVSDDAITGGSYALAGGATAAAVLATDNDDGSYIDFGADGGVSVFIEPLPASQSISLVTIYTKYKFLGSPTSQTLALNVKVGGVKYAATPQSATAIVYTALDDEWPTNPLTTQAWTVPAINAPMAIGFDYADSLAESIRISYLVAKVLHIPQPNEIDAVRDIGTRRVWLRRRGDRRIEIEGGIKLLNYQQGSRLELQHIAGPHELGLGWGADVDERRPLWVESGPHWDSSTKRVRLICIDHRPKLCLMYDSGAAAFSNTNRDGLARMSPGALWTMDRASRAECRDATGQLVSVPDDVEAFADRGQVIQGARTNLLLNSAFGLTSIDTHWTSAGEGSNGSNITPDTTDGLWTADRSPRCAKFIAGSPIHAADLEHVADTISVGTLLGDVTYAISVYHQDTGGALSIAAQRSTDSKWWRVSDNTWQATKTWNPLPQRSTWARDQVPVYEVPLGDLDVYLGIPTATGVAAQANQVAHCQIELGTYAESPIYTAEASYARQADDLRVENNAGKRVLNASHFTVMVEAEPFWNPSDLPGALPAASLWYAYHDANNNLLVQWYGATSSFRAALVANGVSYVASVAASPARDVRQTIAVRFTSHRGELGLAPYTLDIFADGVKGTSVIAAQPMIEASTAYIQFTGWNGYIRQRFSSPQVLTDTEIARGI